MTWTLFYDMNSGGGKKEKFRYCYIEAPEDEAIVIFYNRFGHNPERVTCTCCGPDYSITESKTLFQATAYERGCLYDSKKKRYVAKPDPNAFSRHPYMTVAEFRKREDILIISKDEILKTERKVSTGEKL